MSADAVFEAAIEAGAEDVTSDENGHIIICAFDELGDVSKALEAILGEPDSVRPVWKPQTTTMLEEDKASTMMKLLDTLEDDDDVQNVYSNFEIADDVMAKLTSA